MRLVESDDESDQTKEIIDQISVELQVDFIYGVKFPASVFLGPIKRPHN